MINYHVHTNLSIDCKTSAVDICNEAVKAGLTHIAITDHFDLQDDNRIEYDIEKTVQQYKDIKEMFSKISNINIACGVELGQATQNPKVAQKILAYKEIDFVLGSLHNIKDRDDFYFMDYTTIDTDEMMRLYYDELLELAENTDYDSLAHLDYPKRYLDANNMTLNYTDYDDKIIKIFKTLIEKDKCLELNTSGIGRPIGDFMPGERLLRLYFDVGGRNITIGTDCHRIDKIVNGMQEGYDLLKKIGFSDVSIFEKRKQIKMPI